MGTPLPRSPKGRARRRPPRRAGRASPSSDRPSRARPPASSTASTTGPARRSSPRSRPTSSTPPSSSEPRSATSRSSTRSASPADRVEPPGARSTRRLHLARRHPHRQHPRPGRRPRARPATTSFWRGQAEQLLAAMLWTAANTENHTMRNVVPLGPRASTTPSDDEPGTLAPLVRLLTDNDDPDIAFDAKVVQGWLHGQWGTDPRTTSSVYATAREAVWPWADPASPPAPTAATSPSTGSSTATTPSTCRPTRRRDPSRRRVHRPARTTSSRRRVRPSQPHQAPLDDRGSSLLLDETANTPHPEAPRVGVDRHRRRHPARHRLAVQGPARPDLRPHADTVLTNHRTKLGLPSGLSDLATHRLLQRPRRHRARPGRPRRARVPGGTRRAGRARPRALPLLDGRRSERWTSATPCCSTATCRRRG